MEGAKQINRNDLLVLTIQGMKPRELKTERASNIFTFFFKTLKDLGIKKPYYWAPHAKFIFMISSSNAFSKTLRTSSPLLWIMCHLFVYEM